MVSVSTTESFYVNFLSLNLSFYFLFFLFVSNNRLLVEVLLICANICLGVERDTVSNLLLSPQVTESMMVNVKASHVSM